jgi:hypothetical protein
MRPPLLLPKSRRSKSNNRSGLIGLTRISVTPGHRWGGWAVIKINGTSLIRSSWRACARKSLPSITGITRSNRINEGVTCRDTISSNAACPFSAQTTENPNVCKNSRNASRASCSSSTTKISFCSLNNTPHQRVGASIMPDTNSVARDSQVHLQVSNSSIRGLTVMQFLRLPARSSVVRLLRT